MGQALREIVIFSIKASIEEVIFGLAHAQNCPNALAVMAQGMAVIQILLDVAWMPWMPWMPWPVTPRVAISSV